MSKERVISMELATAIIALLGAIIFVAHAVYDQFS
jgi:hypothetical protein